MVSVEKLRQLALSFEATAEHPHFENRSFKVKNKIFATLNEKENRACLRLPETEQSIFTAFDSKAIHPVPNAWGKHGWTLFYLKKLRVSLIKDALTIAYCHVAPAKLADKYKDEEID